MQNEQRRAERPVEQRNDDADDRMERSPNDSGFTTNVGFPNPNSPGDLTGAETLPGSGGLGAQDPEAGGDVAGDDQAHEESILSNPDVPDADRRHPNADSDRQSGGSASKW